MNGKIFAGGFVAFVVIFGVGLYYALVYAYYEKVNDVTQIMVQNRTIDVTNYEGIDATSSGLKLRGCFNVTPADFEGLAQGVNAIPLSAPKWFECFDVGVLQEDLDAGLAVAYLAAENENDGIDRVIAVYPDGRAYQWRQLNEKYQE
ncbi:MAG: DUF6446 family protein [Paracoccaceae bacterium]|jgi:hypothetical protein